MTVFVTLPASPDDVPRIASLQFEACGTDRGFRTIFPLLATASSLAHVVRQFEHLMDDDPTAHIMIAKETSYGEIVAYAIMHVVGSKRAEDVEEEMLADVDPNAFPPDSNVEVGVKLVANAQRKRNEVVAECFGMGNPYAYLAAVGTNPKFQKQGAASQLVEWAVDYADDRDLPMYIESTPVAAGVYQKFGFREYGRLKIDIPLEVDDTLTNICMVRFPNVA